MPETLCFTAADALRDLRTLLMRLNRVNVDRVWLQTRKTGTDSGHVLAVRAAVLAPESLMQQLPTVLVQKTFALNEDPQTAGKPLNFVCEARALTDRLARLNTTADTSLPVPVALSGVSWAGVSPPFSGWQRRGTITAKSLKEVARLGSERVAQALPAAAGPAVVQRVRESVWSAEMLPGVPAGAAFALETAGFLEQAEGVKLFAAGPWLLCAAPAGQILVKSSP